MRDAVELEQDVDRIAVAIFRAVAHVRLGFAQAALFGDFGDALGRPQELLHLARRGAAALEPAELHRQGIQIRAERDAPQSSRFDHDGAAAAERIEYARAWLGQTFDQAPCGHRMQARGVAVEPMHVLHHALFVRRHVERASNGALLVLGATLERDRSADVTQCAPLAPPRLEGTLRPFLPRPVAPERAFVAVGTAPAGAASIGTAASRTIGLGAALRGGFGHLRLIEALAAPFREAPR